jgi:hypothetical protein
MENLRVPHTGGLNHLKTKSRGDPLALARSSAGTKSLAKIQNRTDPSLFGAQEFYLAWVSTASMCQQCKQPGTMSQSVIWGH